MHQPTPSLYKLYSNDPSFRNALSMTFGPLIFLVVIAIGFAGTGLFEERGPVLLLPIIIISLAVIGAIWLVVRYRMVRSTFRDGITVTGQIVRTENEVNKSEKGRTRTCYYAVVAYTAAGQSFERCIRLPGDPVIYDVTKGGNLNLVVREKHPKIAFIKHIFLE